jgi:hypothetical protein
MRHFDGDRHRGCLTASGLDQRRGQGLQGLRLVGHLALATYRAAGVEHTHLVHLARPVNSHVHTELLSVFGHFSPPWHRPPGRPGEQHRPCTGAHWRNFPLDVPSGATCRGAVRLRRSRRWASMALSASRPRMVNHSRPRAAPPPLPQFSTSWRQRGATLIAPHPAAANPEKAAPRRPSLCPSPCGELLQPRSGLYRASNPGMMVPIDMVSLVFFCQKFPPTPFLIGRTEVI